MAIRLGLATLLAAAVVSACSAGVSSPSASPTTVPAAAPTDAPTPSPTASQAPTEAPAPTPTTAPTATTAPTEAPTSAPTPTPSAAAGVPAAPTNVAMSHVIGTSQPQGYAQDVTTTVRWQEAHPEGVTIRVYGVKACLPKSTANHTPCLAKGTPLPANVRDLIASAPAADGKVSWVWPEWDDIGGAVMAHGPIYWSVVVAAFDPAGHSKFVIVATAEHCTDCTY